MKGGAWLLWDLLKQAAIKIWGSLALVEVPERFARNRLAVVFVGIVGTLLVIANFVVAARTDKNLSDTVLSGAACSVPFLSGSKACQEKSSAQAEVGSRLTLPAEQFASGPQNRLEFREVRNELIDAVSGAVTGWWLPDDPPLKEILNEADLYGRALAHEGSCKALADYCDRYPDGEHNQSVRWSLENKLEEPHSFKRRITVAVRLKDPAGTEVRLFGQLKSISGGYQDACEAVLADKQISTLQVCEEAERGLKPRHPGAKLVGSKVSVQGSSCNCGESTEPGLYSCGLAYEMHCEFEAVEQLVLTSCPSPNELVSLDRLSSNSGPTSGGVELELTGVGFLGASVVRLGAVVAPDFVVRSDTTIVLETPAHPEGPVDVVVVARGIESKVSKQSSYRYAGEPVVTSVYPSWAPMQDKPEVLITGQRFYGVTDVLVGNHSAKHFKVVSPTEIVMIPPGNQEGMLPIRVKSKSGTSNEDVRFHYLGMQVVTVPVAGVLTRCVLLLVLVVTGVFTTRCLRIR